MNSIIIYLLLISAHSILISEAGLLEILEDEIKYYFDNGLSNFTGSDEHNLKLTAGGKLGSTSHSLVWKGVYDDVDVAVKMVWNERSFNKEVNVLEVLNATNNPNIEEYGIPRIFYHGKFLHVDFAIAMTLLNETLLNVHDRYKLRGESLSELSILLIFKGAIETLKYLNARNVVHNDIKPENLFRLGAKIFISDFDLATLDGQQNGGHTLKFASSHLFAGLDRHQMDDLESLAFSIWFIAGVPQEPYGIPEGHALCICKQMGTAEEKMKEKCKHFKDENVRKAFEIVCADEMLINKQVPDYDRIINTLKNAVDEIFGNVNVAQSEWMRRATTYDHSLIARQLIERNQQ